MFDEDFVHGIFEIFEVLIPSVIVGVVFLIFIGLTSSCSRKTVEETWNNGYCVCGGQWEYYEAVGHQTRTSYIYECNKCHTKMEIWELK